MYRCVVVLLLTSSQMSVCSQPAPAQTVRESLAWEKQRRRMVNEVLLPAGIKNPRVLDAMGKIPRHEFVPRHLRRHAYFDMSLPIGESQTISSPFIVAFMTECLDPQPGERVLEIGTGSGYQAAVLSSLAADVFSIEIIESLGQRAAKTLKRLRMDNVAVKVGDGFEGWPEHAPFDKIIVTCSPERVPQALVDQLRDNGRMVIPVGERYQQTMYLLRKIDGNLQREELRPTLFVPMTGRAEDARVVKPDPGNPSVVNGSFEEKPDDGDFARGWYYQRQARQVTAEGAPDGDNYMLFENSNQGQHSHLMQGMALDGRVIPRVRISCWAQIESLAGAQTDGPRMILTFYDENRRDLGQWWIGPWPADSVWRHEQKDVRVPVAAREAIVRIGLFGATGRAAFDAVKIVPRNDTPKAPRNSRSR